MSDNRTATKLTKLTKVDKAFGELIALGPRARELALVQLAAGGSSQLGA